jgi:hypothetical protein
MVFKLKKKDFPRYCPIFRMENNIGFHRYEANFT